MNGVHPGQLSAHQSNGDTQLPYRLPICDATHADAECAANCAVAGVEKAQVVAMQSAQSAQVKYGCEYGSKRLPVPLQELKTWVQGHKALRVRNVSAPEGYMVRRHTKRLISDAYGRGVARGAVEASNLAVHFKEDQCLDAESMRTAESTSFPGHAFLRRLEFVLAAEGADATRAYAALDPRDPRRRKLKVRDI